MACLNRKDLGLLALRLGTGGVLFAHGAQKLFGWFGGGGLQGTAKAMESMGFRPGGQAALAAGLGEAGGGALLALGAATPAAGAAAAGAMAGAVAVHRPGGFFAMKGGYEYPAYLGFMAAGLGLAGPGRYSFDHLTRHRLDRPAILLLAFAASAAAAGAVVNRREATVAAQAEAASEEADAEAEAEGPTGSA
ncbi:RpiR family transcriptional regulator [Streptacidiphilus pinicola]|uniref:RpiR family transcriptional regulator n=1 Tax=Streptacidiphilus pinicola TaxID=2219663 RepID=A0A2X0I6S3_9ACTN|nr:DoxX family membrane protein [Streptacidiphilus pinicola]RAG80672.1 RpiR family transcriptional regulator [Streptacidiphilus pinicola]